ncbi:MAG: Gfo/Idh/MocA family oxidoreductase [Chloroflexaceae bacterium]|jgi:predicted dehydrogenase|nr:Gfo/Idh/MocA family oxidoreductase [Chloroflexaceae bacterium]
MNKQLEIGLVGCGNWGRHILRDLRNLGCRVHVVARSERSRANAQAGGAASIVAALESLPPVQGIVVASATSSHVEVLEALLPRGVPIFCEKPLAASATAATRLAQLAPERLFVMDKWRYHPGIERLAAIARNGELGAVSGVRSTRAQWGNPHSDVDTLWHLAPHDLSIALEILGHLPPARMAFAERRGAEPVGIIGVLGDAPWVAIEVSCRWERHFREVRLHCEEGVAVLGDAYSDALTIVRGGDPSNPGAATTEREPLAAAMPLELELRAFVEHLRGGPPPRSSAAEAALVVSRIAELRALAGLPT